MNKGQAYRFLNSAKLFKLLAKSGLFGVPCQAALTVSQEHVQIVSTTGGRREQHRERDNSPNEKLRHFEMHEVLFLLMQVDVTVLVSSCDTLTEYSNIVRRGAESGCIVGEGGKIARTSLNR